MAYTAINPAGLREMDVILPSRVLGDIYKVHQFVWQAVRARATKTDPRFLFKNCGGIVRVRSKDIAGSFTRLCGCPSKAGQYMPLEIDLKAVRRIGSREFDIEPGHLDAWAADVLGEHGFGVRSLSVTSDHAQGWKFAGAGALDIRFKVARVRADVCIKDHARVNAAWIGGIGRGKRFGLGMPTVAGPA